MLEFGEAEPVDDGCGGYCISNFIAAGLQEADEMPDLLLLNMETAAAADAVALAAELVDEDAAVGVTKSLGHEMFDVVGSEAVAYGLR